MKLLVLSASLAALSIGSAHAYDYVDGKGYRHWNHHGEAKTSRKEVVQASNGQKVEIVQDTVKFRPIDEASN